MHLRQLFDFSLNRRGDTVGLEWDGVEYTFGEINARANRAANALRSRGLVAGDRLCVYLANRIELIDVFLACVKLGIIFVPVNILYREREISHIVSDAEPKMMLTEANLAELACETRETDTFPRLHDDSPVALVYTSGTTGRSKGAILTHNNFASNTANLLACWQITDRDRLLLGLPLFHVHALANGLHCWLASGCRMRLLERFDHRTAVAHFQAFRPTLFFGVPTIYVRLLEFPLDIANEIGKDMRLFVSGSAPLPAQVWEEFRNRFGHEILERYGMSETLMNISNPYVGERRPGTIGFPLPGVSVRLDETGELWVKGPNVCAGYWRREDATRAAFVDGWFRTGDVAKRSEDGYYTLCGRRSDLIISGGFNIYPREIEEFLMEQPEIVEASVIGDADAKRGEVPIAYVVTRGPLDAASIEARCREEFASFKVPRRFEIVTELPRNALGKVQKHLLKRLTET
jgi:malonyl-CoA/methylmalonyl-CoA synthetase